MLQSVQVLNVEFGYYFSHLKMVVHGYNVNDYSRGGGSGPYQYLRPIIMGVAFCGCVSS